MATFGKTSDLLIKFQHNYYCENLVGRKQSSRCEATSIKLLKPLRSFHSFPYNNCYYVNTSFHFLS